ncbi:MAG: glycosyltransferase [Acidimicrobiales bacterium]|jgi:glycosyltransferase involved in cell wall biosynthesis
MAAERAVGPRVAIVHERFTEVGGSERVVEQFHALWPDATVHAAFADPSALPPGLADVKVQTSSLQALYKGGRGYARLLPLMPWAMSHIDVGEADLVVASHHAFANRVRVPVGCGFISYTHTPARWMWDPRLRALEGGLPTRVLLGAIATSLRRTDHAAAQHPDVIVVNSAHVAGRVRRWWGREAQVIHPPVDIERFHPDLSVRREGFFLLAGRLVPYKRPEVAVAAARRAGIRLVVAGEGRSRGAVEQAAGPGVELLGEVDDETLVELYRSCIAVVLPGEEDFGIVPLEAQACGTPVIALRAGGACESVLDGRTGMLYDAEEDEVVSLARSLASFDPGRFSSEVIREHAERFSPQAFRQAVDIVAGQVSAARGPQGPHRLGQL